MKSLVSRLGLFGAILFRKDQDRKIPSPFFPRLDPENQESEKRDDEESLRECIPVTLGDTIRFQCSCGLIHRLIHSEQTDGLFLTHKGTERKRPEQRRIDREKELAQLGRAYSSVNSNATKEVGV